MTAKILVVDDQPINLRLMQARLRDEYFEVILATSGAEAIEICRRETVDLVLLDVMMPEMDGYEVCRRLKADPACRHIPVVLITALDDMRNRITGLEAGADDFLTKPVRDLPLFSRIRSLTRLKILSDEMRTRAETTMRVLAGNEADAVAESGTGGSVLVVVDSPAEGERLSRILRSEHTVRVHVGPVADLEAAAIEPTDLLAIDLQAESFDPLRLCSLVRSNEATRPLPILVLASDGRDETRIAKALELGANDYILRPVDRNELLARARTQVKRRRYDESLRRSLQQTIELATVDALTGLSNRRFFESHLTASIARARTDAKDLSLLIADIDHFKQINDGWGHAVGDGVLRDVAARTRDSLRACDLACRIGGEEFVVVMPDADSEAAAAIAERLRRVVADQPFPIGGEMISVTISVGFSTLIADDTDATLTKRADQALYEAKRLGRNRVVLRAA
ncbi:PleD family two-component system response regulator [Aureimonas pseudogalii]|uniref:diguanylate cyclase n=1 Tax=Aureimonas pseudogalii TaxID=1744844 RepID=A0A7W6H554_9HYPH|nr:PleD family two-component system response regulator [Aureimonas pseudogalii]MBB3998752.1 two-component system cell cycle response regulator [Aureimonas pseudogalii]